MGSIAVLFAGIAFSSTAAAEEPCPPRPQAMPPAIDAVGKLDIIHQISFSATPWEYPGRAWVLRLSYRAGSATLEILRLLRQSSCNRYDIERAWKAPISAAQFDAVAAAVAPWSTPSADAFSTIGPSGDASEIVLDGTGLELRLRTFGWEVRRGLNHYGRTGKELSAIFRALAAKHVPADEMPAEDWSTIRKP